MKNMKKNFNLKLVVWLLAATVTVSAPGSALAMDTVRSKAQWAQTKAARAKEKTIDRLVKQYKETQELHRKKKAGTATPAELATLKRRMNKIKIAAAAIGITLATIAIIAAGTVGYKLYSKKKQEKRRQQEMAKEEIQRQEAEEKKWSDFDQDLSKAFLYGNVDKIKKLLDPVNRDLNNAALYGNVDEVKELLDHGANVNATNYFDVTPLHHAAWDNNLEMVVLLLDRGANVDAQNNTGTPLDLAVRKNHLEIAKLLLNQGAMVSQSNINEAHDPQLKELLKNKMQEQQEEEAEEE